MRRFLEFAGDAVLVAHNARFDMGFLDREVERLTGRRVASPVVDTVWLARRLLEGRQKRVGLASLAYFFGTATRPCHRALADSEATAEILLALIGLAQERGAATVAQLVDLSAPRARRLAGKRSLVAGAPPRPGVYLFRDRNDQVLYVGRARDLRARLRSYFRTERQRPAVEAALGALERVEWRVLGSELEAGLEELRLLRELRPPANARSARPDRYVYLRRRGAGWCVTDAPGPYGPLKSRRRAQIAARALGDWEGEPQDALPALRQKLKRLSVELRFEDAARLRDRIEALEEVAASLAELDRLRALELCLLVPAAEDGFQRMVIVSGGRVAATRKLLPGAAGRTEAGAALAEAARAEPSLGAADADELLLIGTFLRRPPPELRVLPLAEVRAGCLTSPHGLRRHRDLRRPARGGRRAQAQPARRRARPATRPVAGRAARRRGARPRRGRERVRALLLRDHRRRRTVRRRGQAAGRVLRGARRRRVSALERVCDYGRAAGLLVIADGKRGDIGSTARAYAAAYLEPRDEQGPLADALTVNTYLGGDSVEPFLQACRLHGAGIFCLVRTSNAGASDVQELMLSDGRRVWQHVAALVGEWGAELTGERGLSSVGAVVGATVPRAVAEARKLLPRSVLLLPGVGAQGATAADVARAFTSGPASALVTVSRSVIFAYRGSTEDWRGAAGAEAARLRADVWSVSGW